MGAADEIPCSVLAINDRSLLLVQDSAGTWLIRDSADGSSYTAGHRLVWLLPLLERSPADVSAALPQVPLTDTPLPALVRFALTSYGEYWPALALGWLESGWPIGDLFDVLGEIKDDPHLPQPLRHRALRLWLAAAHRREDQAMPTSADGRRPEEQVRPGLLPSVQ